MGGFVSSLLLKVKEVLSIANLYNLRLHSDVISDKHPHRKAVLNFLPPVDTCRLGLCGCGTSTSELRRENQRAAVAAVDTGPRHARSYQAAGMSVLLETSAGDIVIDLLVDYAPKLCEKYVSQIPRRPNC